MMDTDTHTDTHTDTQTHRKTGPILLPRPLTWEVKIGMNIDKLRATYHVADIPKLDSH